MAITTYKHVNVVQGMAITTYKHVNVFQGMAYV